MTVVLSVPWQVAGFLQSTFGASELPVFDLTAKKSSFQSYRARIRPLGPPTSRLAFSQWRLAHAIKKAEWTRYMSPVISRLVSFGFLLENGHMFGRNPQNLRLADDAIGLLDDFSQAALAGRIGQGLSLLYMEAEGYAFAARFSTFCATANVPIPHHSQTPDSVFENAKQERALVESKGGFVNASQSADIKTVIAKSLSQLSNWGSQFSPAITKKYAIASFLREATDPHREPSLTAVVDPDGDSGHDGKPFPEDIVRRENYIAWLRGMGYSGAAERLSGLRPETYPASFRISTVGAVPYAVAPFPAHLPGPDDLSGHFRVRFWRHDFRVPVVGIRLDVLKRVGLASASPEEANLLSIPVQDSGDVVTDGNPEGVYGSRFSDGTFFGNLPISELDSEHTETIIF